MQGCEPASLRSAGQRFRRMQRLLSSTKTTPIGINAPTDVGLATRNKLHDTVQDHLAGQSPINVATLPLVARYDPDQDLSIGAFVRARRTANCLTQEELGELAHVGRRFVSELERDKPTLRLDRVNAVLAVFGKQLGVVDRRRERLL